MIFSLPIQVINLPTSYLKKNLHLLLLLVMSRQEDQDKMLHFSMMLWSRWPIFLHADHNDHAPYNVNECGYDLPMEGDGDDDDDDYDYAPAAWAFQNWD